MNSKYCIRSLSPRGHPAPCSLPPGIGRPHIHASPCARRRGDDRSEERVQCARSYRMYVEIECGGYLKAISGHTWAKPWSGLGSGEGIWMSIRRDGQRDERHWADRHHVGLIRQSIRNDILEVAGGGRGGDGGRRRWRRHCIRDGLQQWERCGNSRRCSAWADGAIFGKSNSLLCSMMGMSMKGPSPRLPFSGNASTLTATVI